VWAVIIEDIRPGSLEAPIVVGPFSSADRALAYYREAQAKKDRAESHGGRYRVRVAELHSPRLFTWLPWQAENHTADVLAFPGRVRASDPITAHQAAKLVTARATSARVLLLEAHGRHDTDRGLTDEEAAMAAGVDIASEYATRCSELKAMGVLADLNIQRLGRSGLMRQARRITTFGREILAARHA
jgi:hypothetical protein